MKWADAQQQEALAGILWKVIHRHEMSNNSKTLPEYVIAVVGLLIASMLGPKEGDK